MKIAKALVLPVVAVAVISIFCKAQSGGLQDPPASAAPSIVANPVPETVSISDLPASNCTRQCADLLNAGLAGIGKEEGEPRKVHFEFTLTLPANK